MGHKDHRTLGVATSFTKPHWLKCNEDEVKHWYRQVSCIPALRFSQNTESTPSPLGRHAAVRRCRQPRQLFKHHFTTLSIHKRWRRSTSNATSNNNSTALRSLVPCWGDQNFKTRTYVYKRLPPFYPAATYSAINSILLHLFHSKPAIAVLHGAWCRRCLRSFWRTVTRAL